MKRYRVETVVGIFVLIGIICLGYMTVKLGKVSFFGNNYYSLFADFTSVSGLKAGNAVEIDGIDVGRVEMLSIDQQKQMAVVELKIKKGIKVYDDASAAIKTSGLIGDKYIKIDPGGSGNILKPGSRISETASPIDLEEMIGKYAFGDINKKTDK
ncbi:MAG TPA: outer membrane lipid asymmetry maintenance protein MlaD [Dissulfurispiraceae bacterium]|nr:outer membrane lipid asymmetry maintenance protein MlaD [Dissulfurispiraceae bacterium]